MEGGGFSIIVDERNNRANQQRMLPLGCLETNSPDYSSRLRWEEIVHDVFGVAVSPFFLMPFVKD